MNSVERKYLQLDYAERRAVRLGYALKAGVCAVVCALLTVIGLSAIDSRSPLVGTLPPAASAPTEGRLVAQRDVDGESVQHDVSARPR